ncbi:hypothetical protein [Halobacillus hunanensis]|uniref:hypothetical protein n=1 Tax=Halobacillus hunanensis TaxID=578214 RepID=UPI001591A9D0|nr:hypothetical protein [Halobacillus hunanensis]
MNSNYMNANHMGNLFTDPQHLEHMYHVCNQHKNKNVHIQTVFGDSFQGRIDHVDMENVHMTLADEQSEENSRLWGGFGYPGYGYGGYGYGYGYPYGYGGYGGYGGIGRLILPLTAIAALSVL